MKVTCQTKSDSIRMPRASRSMEQVGFYNPTKIINDM